MKNILSQEEINEIHEVCTKHIIKNYSINQDGSVDVDGSVIIGSSGFTKRYLIGNYYTNIPIRFNKVSGNFICSHNKLTTLEGCPRYVGGDFNCGGNKLTSLEHSPLEIGKIFDYRSNQITSLEYCPTKVNGIIAGHNKITSLKYCPTNVSFAIFIKNDLPIHFNDLYTLMNKEEFCIFMKYQHTLGIWDDGYNQTEAQLLYDDIKDGLL